MSHPIHHTENSIKLFGGREADYFPTHHWLDATKECFADCRHRALRHHDDGIKWASEMFPVVKTAVMEQHIREDCGGRIPSIHDWAAELKVQDWMQVRSSEEEILTKVSLKYGGDPEDFRPYLVFLQEYSEVPQFGYLRLHAQGIFEMERALGTRHPQNHTVPVRYVGEFLVKNLLNTGGRIPSASDWLTHMRMRIWMNRPYSL